MTQNESNELTRPQLSRVIISMLGLKTKGNVYPSTKEVSIHCPFHKDNTPSMFIDVESGVYHCFSCGRGGSVESLYRDLTGDSIYKVLGIRNDPFSSFARKTYPQVIYDDPARKKTIYINYDSSKMTPALENQSCIDYIDRRGISYGIVEEAGMTYASDVRINTTSFRNRLCIPVYENGLLSSIEGRKLDPNDAGPKVLYPKNTSVDFLYDIDRLDKSSRVYAVEGLMDLFVLRSCNEFSNSTSIFGANVTKRQLEQIRGLKEFVYIPDNDPAGEMTIRQLKDSGLDNIYVLKLPETINGIEIKDVGDLPKAGVGPDFLLGRKWLSYVRKL